MEKLAQAKLKELLIYSPENGVFRWRVLLRPGGPKAGDEAGSLTHDGYRRIKVSGKSYKASRVAWLYVRGSWPQKDIDHINGKRDDDRISNLREATDAENQQNRKLSVTNTSGYTGVCWYRGNKWRARICHNGESMFLGDFLDKEDARDAYLEAKVRLHIFQPTPQLA